MIMQLNTHHHQLLFLLFFLQLQLHFQDYNCLGTSLAHHHQQQQYQQQQLYQRPKPSHDITSLIHLQEIPGSKYDPRSINHAKLKLKLGRHFDPEFMSIYPPEDLNSTFISSSSRNSSSSSSSSNSKKSKKLKPKHKLKKQHSKNGVSGGRDEDDADSNSVLGTSNLLDYESIADKFHGRLRFKFIRKLEKFLQIYTSCPLSFKWRDLGVRFWPRYLREGHCTASGGGGGGGMGDGGGNGHVLKSCSIPPGLYCQPSQQVYKVLLRWHCQNWEQRKRCRWLEIRHPIIVSCSCGTCAQ